MKKNQKPKQALASWEAEWPYDSILWTQAEDGKTFIEKCCVANQRKIVGRARAKHPYDPSIFNKLSDQLNSFNRVYGIPNAFFMELINILEKHNVYRRTRGKPFEIRIEGIPILFSEDKMRVDVDNYIKSQYAPPQVQIETGIFIDQKDDKQYKTVKIGGQIWFAEDFNWEGAGVVNGKNARRLYTWEEAMRAVPPGWHLPTDDEWTALTDYAGGLENAVMALKSEWWGGTDAYGFSALPGGYYCDGGFYHANNEGCWWGAKEQHSEYACHRIMDFSDNKIYKNSFYGGCSFSVRFVKD